jgi:superfamily I DNA/RNA helicase
VLREQTEGLSLREIIEVVLQHSGLVEHYKAEREGADRIENLEELVNAAESFVTQEGFGRDAVALPIDELRRVARQPGLDPSRRCSTSRRPTTCRPMPRPARRCRRWPPSSRTRRWSRATTRRRPARTRCS